MAEKQQIFQQSLELIIESVALSTNSQSRSQAGVYLMGLVIADNNGRLDAEKVTAIQAIIEMSAELDCPSKRL